MCHWVKSLRAARAALTWLTSMAVGSLTCSGALGCSYQTGRVSIEDRRRATMNGLCWCWETKQAERRYGATTTRFCTLRCTSDGKRCEKMVVAASWAAFYCGFCLELSTVAGHTLLGWIAGGL